MTTVTPVPAGNFVFIRENVLIAVDLRTGARTPVLPQTGVSLNDFPRATGSLEGRLFFSAMGPGGRELWRSDGTPAGTVRHADINTAPSAHSDPQNLRVTRTATRARLTFTADDGLRGKEPWAVEVCRADYDHSGAADLLDIIAFLGDWFAGYLRADHSGLAGPDLLDIFAFLEAWFGGC